jgi:hypothetical protein
MSLNLLASAVLGVDGFLYIVLGLNMLYGLTDGVCRDVLLLYTSLFKVFRECTEPPVVPTIRTTKDLRGDLGFRMLACVLVVLGIFRVLTAFRWECMFVFIGVSTYMGEVALLCQELLVHESIWLHKGMFVILLNVGLTIVYLANALPSCI